MIKSRKKGWVRLVARMEEQKILCTLLVRKPEIKRALGKLSGYGRMILI
jgi:hypothetical protein